MIKEIKKQKENIEKIKSIQEPNAFELLPRYQFRGESHSFGKPDKGVNCMEWCMKMLNKGREADKQTRLAISTKPPKCCIL